MKPCAHCGTPFEPKQAEARFCCTGCAHVHALIEGSDYGRFYELRDQALDPVGERVFRERDWGWLEQAVEASEGRSQGAQASLSLSVSGLTCVGCVWLIEKVQEEALAGVRLDVDVQRARLSLHWPRGQPPALEAFARQLHAFGYDLHPARERSGEASLLLRRLGLCGAFALNAMLFSLPDYLGMEPDSALADLFLLLAACLATLSLAVGGSYFITRALFALRQGLVHIDLPIALGLVLAWTGSLVGYLLGEATLVYFDFVAIFSFLMLLGRWLQESVIERNRARLGAVERVPEQLPVLRGQTEVRLGLEEVLRGETYRLARAQPVPFTSRLLECDADFSLEWIHGEADPAAYQQGGLVPAGAIYLGTEPLALEALEEWEHSSLRQLLETEEVERSQVGARFIQGYLLVVLMLSLLGGLGWGMTAGALAGLQVALSILVVSCPCALGVAIPLASELAVARLRSKGVFVRASDLWGRLLQVRELTFDKTGTLTLDRPALLDPDSLHQLSERERAVLAGLVASSLHPVARSLAEALRQQGVSVECGLPVLESAGEGLECECDGLRWRLGQPAWVGEERSEWDCAFSRDGEVLARFRFCEELRGEAREQMDYFRTHGYRLRVLSGDRPEKVRAILERLGLEEEAGMGGLRPEEKAALVDPEHTLMIGDGINDSPAFASALCRGMPAVDRAELAQRADFFFTGSSLSGLRALFEIGVQRRRTLLEVFAFALLYNLLAVGLCLFGLMNPLLAAVLMPLSSLVTILIACQGMTSAEAFHQQSSYPNSLMVKPVASA